MNKDAAYAEAHAAEVKCWDHWERAGKPHPDHTGAVAQAITIAEHYHNPQPSTDEITDAAIRKLELHQ